LGYIRPQQIQRPAIPSQETIMLVSDLLRIKGTALYTVHPDESLTRAVQTMVEADVGSLVVIEHEDVVGMLTFREVMQALGRTAGHLGDLRVRSVMDDQPISCTLATELDEVRRIVLQHHARYLPVIDQRRLHGVISLYDVAKAVVESQNFETKMLKAYIRDWPEPEAKQSAA
jgi:CBS domain-containing protein